MVSAEGQPTFYEEVSYMSYFSGGRRICSIFGDFRGFIFIHLGVKLSPRCPAFGGEDCAGSALAPPRRPARLNHETG